MNTYQLINQWQKILENEFNSLARNDIGYGKGSVVLFLWYKYLYYGKKSDLELCRKYLEQLLQSIQNSLKTPGAFIFVELSEIYFLLSLLNKDRGFKISTLSQKVCKLKYRGLDSYLESDPFFIDREELI